ncbi:hypothetical protein BK120_23765 [Paenibacillus sp. FSL A5-0031]|uniref:DUF3800 domain-containing protein n=1 Tax=Paenibacillus sp. FSL A5-0031 TaxID=1920420 RepID=UPI00096F1243|nr:DUF3800 domain-containing protein [Paenibacillus sp. FSL A5-0031]OME78750.1 hypothetical protein BK120_23765 [Paenibacillus sp. FSL A5-0031]
MNKLKYADFLTELQKGSHYGVFIDETGIPNKEDKKTWVAVIINPTIMREIFVSIDNVIKGASDFTELELKELHFVDIYNGKKGYRDIPFGKRLVIFKVLVDLFKHYNLPILVQSMSPEILQKFEIIYSQGITSFGPFDLTNYNDMGLFYLLQKVKHYILEHRNNNHELARVFIDENYKKNGIGIQSPLFKDVFLDSGVFFGDSADITPIQLADFAAFSLNRTQLFVKSSEPKRRDVSLLEILSPLAEQYIDIDKIKATIISSNSKQNK